jgi:hypothetical protein
VAFRDHVSLNLHALECFEEAVEGLLHLRGDFGLFACRDLEVDSP